MSERNTASNVIRIEADDPALAPVGYQSEPVAASTSMAAPLSPGATETVQPAGAPGTAGQLTTDTGVDETEELREEIEETRTELSDTLNAIQEKLNPQRLMEQAMERAKDTVQETTEHVVAQAKHAAHEAVVDAVDHTKEAVHDATIGKVEHMVSNVTDAAKNLVGATGTSNHSTAASHDTDTRRITGAYDTDTQRVTGAYGTDMRRVAGAYNTSTTEQPPQGVGASLWETIKENPIPTALAAASLGWLFAHRSKSVTASRNMDTSYQQQSFRGQDAVRSTGDTLQDKAGQVANQAGSAIGDTADTLQDKAGQVASTVGSTVGQVGSTVGGTVGSTVEHVGSTVGQVGSTVGSAAGQVGSTVGSTVGGLAEGTQQQAQRAQNQFQRVLHENPLAVGAAGLALGAAIGLAIPETQRENQVLGGTRDTVMDKAVGTAQDTMQKVGTIAQKAESAAESTVKEEAHTQGLVGSTS